jgi:hypothetical protein
MVGGDVLDDSTDHSSSSDDVPLARAPPVVQRKLAVAARARPVKKAAPFRKASKIVVEASALLSENVDLYSSDSSSVDLFSTAPARIFIPKLKVWIELCKGNLIYPRFIFGYGAVLQNKKNVLLLPSGVRGAVRVVPGESYEVVQLQPQLKKRTSTPRPGSVKKPATATVTKPQ